MKDIYTDSGWLKNVNIHLYNGLRNILEECERDEYDLVSASDLKQYDDGRYHIHFFIDTEQNELHIQMGRTGQEAANSGAFIECLDDVDPEFIHELEKIA